MNPESGYSQYLSFENPFSIAKRRSLRRSTSLVTDTGRSCVSVLHHRYNPSRMIICLPLKRWSTSKREGGGREGEVLRGLNLPTTTTTTTMKGTLQKVLSKVEYVPYYGIYQPIYVRMYIPKIQRIQKSRRVMKIGRYRIGLRISTRLSYTIIVIVVNFLFLIKLQFYNG